MCEYCDLVAPGLSLSGGRDVCPSARSSDQSLWQRVKGITRAFGGQRATPPVSAVSHQAGPLAPDGVNILTIKSAACLKSAQFVPCGLYLGRQTLQKKQKLCCV